MYLKFYAQWFGKVEGRNPLLINMKSYFLRHELNVIYTFTTGMINHSSMGRHFLSPIRGLSLD